MTTFYVVDTDGCSIKLTTSPPPENDPYRYVITSVEADSREEAKKLLNDMEDCGCGARGYCEH
jgi:hypothetical protein